MVREKLKFIDYISINAVDASIVGTIYVLYKILVSDSLLGKDSI